MIVRGPWGKPKTRRAPAPQWEPTTRAELQATLRALLWYCRAVGQEVAARVPQTPAEHAEARVIADTLAAIRARLAALDGSAA